MFSKKDIQKKMLKDKIEPFLYLFPFMLFLIVLLAVGLTILMWTPITEVCILNLLETL